MQSLIDIISGIIYEYPHSLGDRKLLSSILNDYIPGLESTRNILLLLYFDLNIHKEMKNTGAIDDFFITRIARKLENQYRIDFESAKSGVLLWVDCLKNVKLPEV